MMDRKEERGKDEKEKIIERQVYICQSGAMGSFFGGLLAEQGLDVVLVDVWQVRAGSGWGHRSWWMFKFESMAVVCMPRVMA